MKNLMIFRITLAIILGLIVVTPLNQQSHGLISGVSEYFDERPELYRIGQGSIMEFVEDPASAPCVQPNVIIKDTDLLQDPIADLAKTDNNLFIFLNKYGQDSFRLLNVEMPDIKGYNNYYGYVYDDEKQYVTGYGYGLESRSLVAGIETLDKNTMIDEDKRFDEFIQGETKFEIFTKMLNPGDFSINFILYNVPQYGEKTTCVIMLDWEFSVDDDGSFSTKAPQTKTGTIIDITSQFSPHQQIMLGFEQFMIKCKEGYSSLSQKDHFFHDARSACVTPETKTKLIERGWNLAAPTSELTYFDKSQELEISQKYEDFMKKQDYNNVPSAFVIGKHNFKNNDDITYFCGEFRDITVNYQHYFYGAIDGSGNLVWDGIQEQSPWCAINDDAPQFSFTYHWETKEK